MLKLFKLVCPVIALLFVAKLLFDYWPEIGATAWHFNYPLLALSLLLLVGLFFLDALGWWLLLKAAGERIPASGAIAVWLRSSLSRYIPGVVWAYAGRAVLAKEYGVETKACLKSMVLENIMLVLGSFTVGLPALTAKFAGDIKLVVATYLATLIAIVGILSPPGLRLLGRAPVLGKFVSALNLPSVKSMQLIYFFYCAFWMLFGSVFVLFLWALNLHFDSLWTTLLAGSAFSASFCIGFVLIVFPGGLGIREVTLFGFLSGTLGPAVGIAIAAASRVWLIAGELSTLTTFALWAGRRGPRQPGS